MRAAPVYSTISSPNLTCLWLETWRWWLRTQYADMLVDSTQDNGSNGSDQVDLTAYLSQWQRSTFKLPTVVFDSFSPRR